MVVKFYTPEEIVTNLQLKEDYKLGWLKRSLKEKMALLNNQIVISNHESLGGNKKIIAVIDLYAWNGSHFKESEMRRLIDKLENPRYDDGSNNYFVLSASGNRINFYHDGRVVGYMNVNTFRHVVDKLVGTEYESNW